MNKSEEYKLHIVSDDDTCRFIHRTIHENIESILKEGLKCGAGDLSSTATTQPRDLDTAERIYRLGYPEREVAIVVALPRGSFRKADEAGLTPGIGYFHPERGDIAIRPQFIEGWIDRKSDRYYVNPHKSKIIKDERFDQIFG
jgi:hypothetical protein